MSKDSRPTLGRSSGGASSLRSAGGGILEVLDSLHLERRLPAPVDEPLAETVRDEGPQAVNRRALRLSPVAADSLAELLQLLGVGVARRLLARWTASA